MNYKDILKEKGYSIYIPEKNNFENSEIFILQKYGYEGIIVFKNHIVQDFCINVFKFIKEKQEIKDLQILFNRVSTDYAELVQQFLEENKNGI